MLWWLVAFLAGIGLVGLFIAVEVFLDLQRARPVQRSERASSPASEGLFKYDVKAFIMRVAYDVKTFGAGTGRLIPHGLARRPAYDWLKGFGNIAIAAVPFVVVIRGLIWVLELTVFR
jgi:hypothetical protein